MKCDKGNACERKDVSTKYRFDTNTDIFSKSFTPIWTNTGIGTYTHKSYHGGEIMNKVYAEIHALVMPEDK